MKLPRLPYAGRYRTAVQTAFGGLDRSPGAADGALREMTNLSARAWPLLAPREKRGLERTLTSPGGLGADGVPFWTEGTELYVNGTAVGTVSAGEKKFAAMGSDILIFPDKLRYDRNTGTLSALESVWTGGSLEFRNGQLYGAAAEANALYADGTNWADYFKPGDGVTVSGCTRHPENDRTLVIREVSGAYLYFYEYSFVLEPQYRFDVPDAGLPAGNYHFAAGSGNRSFTLSTALAAGSSLTWDGAVLTLTAGGVSSRVPTAAVTLGTLLTFDRTDTLPYTETGSLSVARRVPALEQLCVNENRLWGCAGKRIYASKLGDPANFEVFDGLSTDSWQSDTLDAGDFTACVSYLGYPVFFKEDSVCKVYGDRPANFQWTPSARLGVLAGCEKSLAVAGETLYYLSRAGVAAYTGGIPSIVSAPLGAETRWQRAVAGSDGTRYYVSLYDGTVWALYVYDTRYGVWHREDAAEARDFAFWDGGLHLLLASGGLYRLDGSAGTAEDAVSWEAEFADLTDGSPEKKGVLRLLLRAELEAGASLTAAVRYDSAGDYQTVKTLSASRKRSFVLPLAVRRCDHWALRLSGTGDCRVHSLAFTRYAGSERE